ncbi:ABC transporter permease [Bifidobacterium oedipodis]|uniref:ABC transporter permease n=1 Tax=Bifidobacterium oedipodis TaxID=2675322 RepID=A0A7Y0EMA4_9BIFI|nr:ABC transporter permease subunit [Bifidobacterium sp. DSM 109957]NMM92862.1 ABC transporter permease [Bifidobacterium sp. DSM 109957]
MKKQLPAFLAHRWRLVYLVLPFVLFVFVFHYLPILGWYFAFVDFQPGVAPWQMPFAGLKWFTSIISSPEQINTIIRVMKNTLGLSFLGLLTSVFPLIFAVLLYELRSNKLRRLVQTLSTAPHFVSWVLVYSLVFAFISVDNGVVNNLLMQWGVIDTPINFLLDSNHMWLKMTVLGVWKSLGWSAIMYLAAINGIDQELYEAASIDGASRFQRAIHVTIPGLMPTFFVLILMNIANIINTGMDQYFVFSNAMNKDAIEVLDLYVYNIGISDGNFSFATVISILKTVVSLILLFTVNKASRIVRGESIF